GFPRFAFAVVFVEQVLADADVLGGDLDQLVVLDVFEARFERHLADRADLGIVVLARGADVGELLAADDVDHQIARTAVLADDLPLIHLLAWADEEYAA